MTGGRVIQQLLLDGRSYELRMAWSIIPVCNSKHGANSLLNTDRTRNYEGEPIHNREAFLTPFGLNLFTLRACP